MIPEISAAELDRRASRIKPVVMFLGMLHYIRPVDIKTASFLWSPVKGPLAEGLVFLREIRTFHSYAYYGFFKPTVAEVLAQLPDDSLLPFIAAFEIVRGPERAEDLNREAEALNNGYHVALTRIYSL
jgi:hypothetical protein